MHYILANKISTIVIRSATREIGCSVLFLFIDIILLNSEQRQIKIKTKHVRSHKKKSIG